MYFAYLLVAVCLWASGARCTTNINGNVAAATTVKYPATNPPPLVHSFSSTGQNLHRINDADYWDNDDFVPYKNDRHDSFDWRLLMQILTKEKSNAIISTFSVKLVLTLLLEASAGDTNTQHELAAIFPNMRTPHLIREHFKPIFESLKEESIYYNLNIGTKLFVDDFIEPRQRYSSILKSSYHTDVERLSFKDGDKSTKIINDWCANITEGHIKNIVSQDKVQNSIMLFVNALYFDGLWRRPFNNETFESPFFVQPSRQVKTEFMTQTDYFYFFESSKLNAKIVRMPYKGKKFSMTIVLPNAKGGLEELARELDGDLLRRTQWLMDEVQVKLTLPKFKFEYTSQMKEVLQNLGINDIFTDNASLPGIDRGAGLNNQMKVSNIIQKAGLVVHERGSTAYAATQVEITNKFGGNTLEEFNANRPFIFFIEDETTGNMLFAGKVLDPTI